MKRIATIGMIAAAAWFGAGCADQPDTELEDTGRDTATLTDTARTGAGGAGAAAGGTTLGIDSLPEVGAYLTDGQGRAVYLLEGETADSTMCQNECANEWPPVPAGQPMADAVPGLQQNLVGSVDRGDGTTQLTYNGHPLYYYRDDQGAGQTTGQQVTDQWGTWFLVTPAGEPLRGGGGQGG